MDRLNDKWLRKHFDAFNDMYFYGRIPSSVIVKFGDPGKNNNGVYDLKTKTITIEEHNKDRKNVRYIKIDLIHEMAHAYLDVDGYVGHEVDPLHGTRFKGEICRLWNIGAYDGLL